MAEDKTAADKTAAAKATTQPGQPATQQEASQAGPGPVLGAQQPAVAGAGASGAKPGDVTAAQKKVADAKKALTEAEAELAKAEGHGPTTAEQDKKAADERAKAVLAGNKPGVVISGRAGGVFSIDGEGFGNGGVLMIGGRVIPTTRWNDRSIKGELPADLPPGDVSIKLASGAALAGKWPPVLVPTKGGEADVLVRGQVVSPQAVSNAPAPVKPQSA